MKRVHEHADRNKGLIADVLDSLLPATGLVLEISSGTGQYVTYFARRFPHLKWQPSDPDAGSRASILAYLEHSGLSNVRAPLALDTSASEWPISRAAAIVCLDLTRGLFEKAAALLEPGSHLFLVGRGPGDRDLAGATPLFAAPEKIALPGEDYLLVFERNGSSGQSGSTPPK